MKKNRVFTGDFIEILEDDELRDVLGGYFYFDKGYDCTYESGTCGWKEGGSKTCGVSMTYAKCMYDTFGGNWCCDSCGTASYCNGGTTTIDWP